MDYGLFGVRFLFLGIKREPLLHRLLIYFATAPSKLRTFFTVPSLFPLTFSTSLFASSYPNEYTHPSLSLFPHVPSDITDSSDLTLPSPYTYNMYAYISFPMVCYSWIFQLVQVQESHIFSNHLLRPFHFSFRQYTVRARPWRAN